MYMAHVARTRREGHMLQQIVCFCMFVLQETLRVEFSDRTLLAVAHRLHTIIEADRWGGYSNA